MQNDLFEFFPTFQLSQVVLRQILPEQDYENYFHYMNHPEVAKYLSSDDLPIDLEAAKKELNYWSSLFGYRSSFYWAVALKESNQLIGTCGFNHWNKTHNRGEISYDLDRNYWGRGIMSEAIKEISKFGLEAMKMQRIQATIAIDNIPSLKMIEKGEFNREGLMKSFGLLHGEVKDFYMYSRTTK